MAHSIGRSAPAASAHLTRLEAAGLIERRRSGKAVMCRITDVGRRTLTEHATPAPARNLADEDPDDVFLWVAYGASLIPYAASERPEWDRQMVSCFGASVTPYMDILHAAALRLRAEPDEDPSNLVRVAVVELQR